MGVEGDGVVDDDGEDAVCSLAMRFARICSNGLSVIFSK